MVNKLIIALLVVICSVSCATYEFGGMIAASSSVQQRFNNSMKQPDIDFYPDKVETDANAYRFLVATDFHIQEDQWNKVGNFMDYASSDDFMMTMMLGDFMYVAGSSLDRLADSISIHDNLRTYPAIGNHDVYKDGYQNTYRANFGATSYYFTLSTPEDDDLFIILDSANGTLGKEQFHWLESLLSQERNTTRNCYVFTHANFFSPPDYMDVISTYPVEAMMKILDLFSKYDVTAVFTGHSHVRDVTILKGTKYITVGSWCDKGEYCMVECTAYGELNVSFHPVSDTQAAQ